MRKLAIGLPFMLASVLAHPVAPAAAEQRVAIVLREPGATVVAEDRIRGLVERLWAWGVEVVDASRAQSADDVARIVPEFERRLAGADASLLYYVGASRAAGQAAPGPAAIAATGQPPVPPVEALLAAMHARSRQSFAALDLIDDGGAGPKARFQVPPAGGHLVAFTTAPAATGTDRYTLAASLVRQLHTAGPALPLVRLAMLAKEDVAIESGGMDVPWVIGAPATDGGISRLPESDVQRLRLAALDRLVADKSCAAAEGDRVQQAVAAYAKAGRRKTPIDPMRLSGADADDMLWQLRMAPDGCRLADVFAGSAPPRAVSAGIVLPRSAQPADAKRRQAPRAVAVAVPASKPQPAAREARPQKARQAATTAAGPRGQNISPPSF